MTRKLFVRSTERSRRGGSLQVRILPAVDRVAGFDQGHSRKSRPNLIAKLRVVAAEDFLHRLEQRHDGSRLEPYGHDAKRAFDIREGHAVEIIVDDQDRLEDVAHPTPVWILFRCFRIRASLEAAQRGVVVAWKTIVDQNQTRSWNAEERSGEIAQGLLECMQAVDKDEIEGRIGILIEEGVRRHLERFAVEAIAGNRERGIDGSLRGDPDRIERHAGLDADFQISSEAKALGEIVDQLGVRHGVSLESNCILPHRASCVLSQVSAWSQAVLASASLYESR